AHDIRCQNRVGFSVLGNNALGQRLPKELANRLDALFACDVGDIRRWLYAEMADAPGFEMPQHDAVIAAELDNERIITSGNCIDSEMGEPFKVHLHVARRTGEKSIMAVKHSLRCRLLDDLEHSALGAIGWRKFEEILRGDLVGRQESVGDRHLAEAHEGFDLASANTAGCQVRSPLPDSSDFRG